MSETMISAISSTPSLEDTLPSREQMNIVVVGHVDHGKSTVIGRLMADTGSLPEGKLQQVQEMCRKNARPFEYAFLMDALKDEQAQGITIDTARCFFRTAKRDYIIIDAPGHVEFLKNMVSGAARAEAALLVIDANEGIRENSCRHGYMLSMLGVKQVVVLVNKMDLVGYDLSVFEDIRRDYGQFLARVGITPIDFIPVCAREGENIATRASWYEGRTVLEHVDAFSKETELEQKPFRFPVQDIYKFTASNDDRRIFAGTVESGSIRVGEEVVFLPSNKRSRIKSIEVFNRPAPQEVRAGEATGFTLTEEIYVRPGEVICRAGDSPARVTSRLRANIFWMGKAPLIKHKKYKLKLATGHFSVHVAEVVRVLDASELDSVEGRAQVERHEVAECILESTRPIALDCADHIAAMGRFVLVDNYDIAGGGIVTEVLGEEAALLAEQVRQREQTWEHGPVSSAEREKRHGHRSKFIVVAGDDENAAKALAAQLERQLFSSGCAAYCMGFANLEKDRDPDADPEEAREQAIRKLGDVARILTDSGQIFITAVPELAEHELKRLKKLNEPNEILVVALGRSSTLAANIRIAEGDGDAIAEVLRTLRQHDVIDYSI